MMKHAINAASPLRTQLFLSNLQLKRRITRIHWSFAAFIARIVGLETT
jgi:hypothetical protein